MMESRDESLQPYYLSSLSDLTWPFGVIGMTVCMQLCQARPSALAAHLVKSAGCRILELRKPCGVQENVCHVIRHAVWLQETQARSKSCPR